MKYRRGCAVGSIVVSKVIRAEVRAIRKAFRKVTASKKSALRFLASTGMYDTKGRLKPQFR